MVYLTSYLLQSLLSFRTASGVLLGFTDNTKSDITTSFLISFGKNGRIGLSIALPISIDLSVGFPSLFKYPPGILPTEYSLS